MGVCRYHGVTRLRQSKAGGRPAHAGLRTNIRLMFHAMVTRCHSPLALSRPRRLNWRKIAALVDAPGNLVRFTLLPGQRHDIKSVDDLLKGIDCEAFLGDKAFDAKAPPSLSTMIARNTNSAIWSRTSYSRKLVTG